MPNFNAHAIFCDDIRREIGGTMSLMGVYGTVAQRVAKHPLRLACVVVINCDLGEDISKLKVEMLVHVDGAETPEVTKFPALPAGKTRADPVMQVLIDRFDGRPPGGVPKATMVGILQAEGIKFEDSCVFSAQIDGVEISRLTFFRKEKSAGEAQAKLSSTASDKKRAVKTGSARKATVKRKKQDS
ncbi:MULTISPECIES: hypothetical protein [Stenotrophomonas]|uniref:hypothetical protein n=1 Tax=Stenotrophomonas TaxID=40323 RepID=UPI0022EB8546|nr:MULTISPECIES: hypothetical protein [Stenotrophomonas]MDA3306118.1 hypothetical protein [Stenotrophomonas sp. PI_27]WGS56345.1 hypothetical protein IAI57_15825 [Stenotrophomonas pavanii]